MQLMSDTELEVFRSLLRADCHERAFMLAAVGIPSVIGFDGVHYLLQVEPAYSADARSHLLSYARESRDDMQRRATTPAMQAPRLYSGAWVGAVVYVVVLVAVGLAVANGWWRLDSFEVGELDAGRVQSGQWWRAWTALTLHLDSAHLAANLGAGACFGYLAARQIGSGSAWLLIVCGAALANLFESQFGPSSHRAVGASTAVFTALGLLAAHSWRTRLHLPQGWAWRWAPLVAGAVLLGWFGSAGEGTDIVAHALGFAFGCLLGVGAALPIGAKLLNGVPQWLSGGAVVAAMVIAWACALAS